MTTTTMKPQTLHGHEVSAILDRGECLIVRVVKPQPFRDDEHTDWWWWLEMYSDEPGKFTSYDEESLLETLRGEGMEWSPLGQPGERRWVREKWCCEYDLVTASPTGKTLYAADGMEVFKVDEDGGAEYTKRGTEASPWLSPATMPRDFSRLTIEVVEPGAGRVQELGYDSFIYMGWNSRSSQPMTNRNAGEDARDWFIATWDRHNPRFPYSSNPWIWWSKVRRCE